MVSKGQFVGLDWNRIARLHRQVTTGTHELTNSIALSHSISCCCYFIFNILTLEVGWLHLDML